VEKVIRRELDGLLEYATAVTRSASRSPERSGIVDGGRGYIGGALTTLHHVGLLTDDEFQEWWDRLMDQLPPTDWTYSRGSS
jgi:hypothetical protein